MTSSSKSSRRQVISINNVLVEENNLHRALWHACAGKHYVPKEGDQVVYFLQPHIDEVRSYAEPDVLVDVPPNIPATILCTVTNVQLLAEPETDEVIANLTLAPQQKGYIATKPEQRNVSSKRSEIRLFSKTLTASDVSKHGGYTIPKSQAEGLLPHMEVIDGEANQIVNMYDLHGEKWSLRHAIRGNPRRHSFTTGWSKFLYAKRLIKGDTLVYLRDENGEFRIGVRRSRNSELRAPPMASIVPGQTLQFGILATVAHALHAKTMFSVYCRPWRGHSSFLVPLHQYLDSIQNVYPDGARFMMSIERDECEERRFTGRIDGTEDLDPIRWPGSKWKCLKVTLDFDPSNMDCPYKPERVSPWEIELLSPDKRKHQVHSPFEQKKHFRSNLCFQGSSSTTGSEPGWIAEYQGQSSLQGFFPSTPTVGSSSGFGILYKPKLADDNENEPKFLNPPRFKSITLFGKNIVGIPLEELPSHSNKTNHHTPVNLGDIQSNDRQQEQACDKGYCQVQVIKYNTTLDIRYIDLSKMSGYDDLIREIDAMFGFTGSLRDGISNWYMTYVDANGYIVGDCTWNEFASFVKRIDVFPNSKGHTHGGSDIA